MAADLHIHVIGEHMLDDAKAYLLCDTSHRDDDGNEKHIQTMWVDADGKEYPFWHLPEDVEPVGWVEYEHECDEKALLETPNVWIGEVSWLKASLFDAPGEYIPPAVETIKRIVETVPTLTEELLDQIVGALASDNPTSYRIAEADDVRSFLQPYIGKHVFPVSW